MSSGQVRINNQPIRVSSIVLKIEALEREAARGVNTLGNLIHTLHGEHPGDPPPPMSGGQVDALLPSMLVGLNRCLERLETINKFSEALAATLDPKLDAEPRLRGRIDTDAMTTERG